MLRAFVEEILRSLEPPDAVDRWCWRLFFVFLAGLLVLNVISGG